MSKSIQRLLLAAIFLVSGISIGLAQAPSGVLTNFISGSTAPVYDLTGSYGLDQTIEGIGGTPVDLSFQVFINQDAQGRLQGLGNITLVGVGNNVVAGIYTLSGRVLTTRGETHARFIVHMRNRDVVAGVNSPFNIVIRYDFVISHFRQSVSCSRTCSDSGRPRHLGP